MTATPSSISLALESLSNILQSPQTNNNEQSLEDALQSLANNVNQQQPPPTYPPFSSPLPFHSSHPPQPSSFECITIHAECQQDVLLPRMEWAQQQTPPSNWPRLKLADIHPIVGMWERGKTDQVNTLYAYLCDANFGRQQQHVQLTAAVKKNKSDMPWYTVAETLFKRRNLKCRETMHGLIIFSGNDEKCLWVPWVHPQQHACDDYGRY